MPQAHDDITFGLALVGFAMLASDAARSCRGSGSRAWTVATVAVVLAHVGCVWGLRYGFDAAAMWRKGAVVFVLFHGAALALVAAAFLRESWRRRCVVAAFGVVCVGALPAPVRYPELALLRWPVLAIAAAAAGAIVRGGRRQPTAAR
jgi:hypothetical protein